FHFISSFCASFAVCLSECCRCRRLLSSFPTRRSSDLPCATCATILLAVRHPDIEVALRHALQRGGHSVMTAANRGDVLPALYSEDRKSTRLNSSHVKISYAVFCLKKEKNQIDQHTLLN